MFGGISIFIGLLLLFGLSSLKAGNDTQIAKNLIFGLGLTYLGLKLLSYI